jgi:hypothetical protein
VGSARVEESEERRANSGQRTTEKELGPADVLAGSRSERESARAEGGEEHGLEAWLTKRVDRFSLRRDIDGDRDCDAISRMEGGHRGGKERKRKEEKERKRKEEKELTAHAGERLERSLGWWPFTLDLGFVDT